jgi:hypothetical protein
MLDRFGHDGHGTRPQILGQRAAGIRPARPSTRLTWNKALETGASLVADKVQIELNV